MMREVRTTRLVLTPQVEAVAVFKAADFRSQRLLERLAFSPCDADMDADELAMDRALS